MKRLLIVLVSLIFLSACTAQNQNTNLPVSRYVEDPLTIDETQDLLSESMKNWTYGEGVGDTAIKVTASIAFPPFAILWLGNSAVELAGYQGFSVSKSLPGKAGDKWSKLYSGLASTPGRVNSKLVGTKFRDSEVAQIKIKEVLNRHENPVDFSDV